MTTYYAAIRNYDSARNTKKVKIGATRGTTLSSTTLTSISQALYNECIKNPRVFFTYSA